MRRVGILLLIVACVVGLSGGRTASAAGTISLSHAKVNLKLEPGDTEQIAITVRNSTTAAQTLSVIFNDFTSPDDGSGSPKILIDGSKDSHGLSSWLSGSSSMTVGQGAAADYVATVSVPPQTTAGSYYGVIRFVGPAEDGTEMSIASLIFVDVGSIEQQVAIKSFDIEDGLTATLENTGNGYTVPKVVVAVRDSQQNTLEEIDLNSDKGGVLPGGTRMFSGELPDGLDKTKDYTFVLTVTTEAGSSVTAEKVLKATAAPQTTAANPVQETAGATKFPVLPVAGGAVAVVIAVVTTVLVLRKRHSRPASPVPLAGSNQQSGSPNVNSTDTPGPPPGQSNDPNVRS